MSRKSKNWKEYLLEFFMLFLAVSLGFLADNYRENISDRSKEKEYIRSMIEDVEEDRRNIETVLKNNELRANYLDSLATLCMHYEATATYDLQLYKYFPIVLSRPDYIAPTELTLQQLKNAGGMRLIKSKKAINAIIRYDSKAKQIDQQQVYYSNYHQRAIDLGTKLFNIHYILSKMKGKNNRYTLEDLRLISNDAQQLKEFGNTTTMYQGIVESYKMLVEQMDKEALTLKETLEQAYEL
jgi:hypothetical protein